jgi:segregation and condensation protein B
LKRELEALLFATDSPLTIANLKKIFPERENAEIRAAISELEQDYTAAGLAFTVVEFGGGWQIATRPEYAPLVENLLKSRSFTRLSKAGLEVLAIIAYRQPITRLEIDEIRGVNSSGAISTLTERNLITVVGRSQAVGNPLLYGTTREFLNHLGLKGLGQLPDLPALEGVLEDREQLKEFASRIGREVTDEELEEYFSAPLEDFPLAPATGDEAATDDPDGAGPEDAPVADAEPAEAAEADEALQAGDAGEADQDDEPR